MNRVYPDLEIIIVAFQYPFVRSTYMWRGNKVIGFGGRERSKLHRLRIWIQAWKTLAHLRRKKEILGVFSIWCTECALIGTRFGRVNRIAHCAWLCGQDAKAGNKYVKMIRPAPGELATLSDFLQREFAGNYDVRPAHVIPIGVDTEEFPAGAACRDIDILGAGSLIPLKQYDVFVKVAGKIKRRFPDLVAKICGDGPERGRLEASIRQHALGDNLELTGEIAHDEVLALMLRTKVFVHTSNYEGFGAVCIEALYAGAHVVSFTKPMDKFIPHWHHVRDAEEMEATVVSLLENQSLKHECIMPFSAEDTARGIIGLFR